MEELTGNKTLAGRWGPTVLFAAGWYVLPKGVARARYLQSYALAILGLIALGLEREQRYPYDPDSVIVREWHEGWAIGWFSGLFFIGSALCMVAMFREVRAMRHAAYVAHTLESDGAATPVEDTEEPPAARVEIVDLGPAEDDGPRLWTPSNHVPYRRVRRGGTTLSGTPINDRRRFNPDNL